MADLVIRTNWIWKVLCQFNVSGTTNSSQPVYYPLDDFKLQVFSGTNRPGIEAFFTGDSPTTIYSTGTSHVYYENILSATTDSSDSAHNYFPMDFWTLAQQRTYSAITSENFYYSVSGSGHQAGVFSGVYTIYGVCIEHNKIQHYTPSDINRTNIITTRNNAVLNANYFSLLVMDELRLDNVSMVDVGLGHAGSALTGSYGMVNVISSAIPFSEGMPCFVSRIGSPGVFVSVPPNNIYEVFIKSTGEIASTNRARSLWSMFDDYSELYYNIADKLGFTPNDIYNTSNLQNKFRFSEGYQQDGNRLILTSDMLDYVGTPNYFVNEQTSTNWIYSNYTTSLSHSFGSGTGELAIAQIKLSANTKYIVCLPNLVTTQPTSFNLTAKIGTSNISCSLLHFYRGPYWNKQLGYYVSDSEQKKYVCTGALLIKTPNTSQTYFNVYINVVDCFNSIDFSDIKVYLESPQTLFYHPILKDNYLDADGPRPVDADDM